MKLKQLQKIDRKRHKYDKYYYLLWHADELNVVVMESEDSFRGCDDYRFNGFNYFYSLKQAKNLANEFNVDRYREIKKVMRQSKSRHDITVNVANYLEKEMIEHWKQLIKDYLSNTNGEANDFWFLNYVKSLDEELQGGNNE